MRLHSFHQKARLSAASAIDQLRSMLAKSADGTVTYQLDLSELEDRILLSASPAAAVMVESAPTIDMAEIASPLDASSTSLFETTTGATAGVPSSDSPQDALNAGQASSGTLLEPASPSDLDGIASSILFELEAPSERTVTEVVFIDDSVEDFQQLVADLQAQRDAGRAVDFFVLDSEQDGIDQIAETLQRYVDLDAVHIVSHGTSGAVKLGATWLRIGSLDGYAGTIAGWGSAFGTDGDLLIYGCDLASSSRGELLVDSIAALTGADVAASTDDTGSALLGGDWELEFSVGTINSEVVFTSDLQENWNGLLAAAAVDAASSGSTADQSSVTVSHTTSGSNRLMLVGVSTDPHGESVSSVTYNGANLTLVGIQQQSGAHARVEIWELVAPDTGTHDVVVNLTGNGHRGVVVGVTTFTGVDQATPTVGFTGNSGNSSTASTTVASAVDDLVFGVVGSHDGTSIDPGTGQTEYWDIAVDNSNGSGTVEAGATSVTASWSVKDDEWAAAAVSVRAVRTITPLTNVDEFRVNTTTGNTQETSNEDRGSSRAVAIAPNGEYVVVWSSDQNTGGDGDGFSVVMQRFDAAGNKLGSEQQVNTQTSNDQFHASVAIDNSGRGVVVWTETNGSSTGVRARLFNSDGTFNGGQIVADTTTSGDQDNATVAMDAAGNFVVVWEGSGPGDSSGIFAQRFDSSGTKLGAELRVNNTTSGTQNDPSVAMNSSGEFAIAWEYNGEIYIRHFDATGTATHIDTLVDNTLAAASGPSVAIDAAGRTVVVYRTNGFLGAGAGVWGKAFNFDGTLRHDFFEVSDASFSSDNSEPSISMDASGNFIVVYHGNDDGDGNGDSVKVRRYNANTTAIAASQIVNTTTTGNQNQASIALLDIDNYVVVWSGNGNQSGEVDSSGVFARQYGTGTDINVAPSADAGGQYVINEGDSVNLIGSASSDPDSDPLAYMWDLDNDGNFGEPGEPTTETPTVDWSTLQTYGIDDDGVYTIGLRVDDGRGGINTTTTTLTVNNVAPTLSTTGTGSVTAGGSYTLNLSAIDPGEDTIGSWTINWGDGSIETFAGNPASVNHIYAAGGLTHNLLASATDEDGTFLQNDLIVVDYKGDSVFRFAATTGAFLQEFATGQGLNNPVDAIVGPDGNLYVSGDASQDILRYNATTGAFIDTFVASGTAGLSAAEGMAFGTDGNLYVADYSNDRVMRFDGNSGAYINDFVTVASGGLNTPYGLTFGPDGNLYVNSYTDDNVLRFDGSTGAFIDEFVSAGDGGLDAPEEMVFGPDGNLYVASLNTDSVLRFNGTTGAFIDEFISSGSGGLDDSSGLAFGPDGNLYVSDNRHGAVHRYDGTTGAFIDLYVAPGAGGLSEPAFIEFLPEHQVTVGFAPDAVDDAYAVDEGATLNVTVQPNWFNSNWSFRQELSLDNSAQASDLIDYPILVKLHASAGDATNVDYSQIQDAGQDLRFVDGDGTVLAHEIELWDETGYSYVWVNVPQIDGASSSDSITMYYGNAAAADGQSATTVWNSGERAVLHLNSFTTDSSPFDNDGVVNNAFASNGIIAGAALFDGNDGDVNLGSDSSIDNIFVGGGTISAWINPSGWGENGFGRIADKANSTFGSNGDGWTFKVNGSGTSGALLFNHGFTATFGDWSTPAGSLSLNSWQHVAITYDNSSVLSLPRIFINGVEQTVTQNQIPVGLASSDAAIDLTIGNYAGAPTRTFDGLIDELRISSNVESPDEIAAQYDNVAGSFISSAGVVSGPGGLLDNDSDPESDNLSVSIVSGPANAATFTLNADGSFDYEHDGTETTSDSFVYQIDDGNGGTATATVNLTINPQNDAPTDISLGNSTIDENTVAGTVGTLSTTDTDPGDSHTYTVDDTRFEVVGGQLRLKAGQSLDFETEPTVSLTVTTTDSGMASFNKAFVVSVNDVNEAPSVSLSQSSSSLPENADTSSAITLASVSVSDDALGSNLLALSGTDAARFEIVGGNLRLKAATPLDFESQTTYSVTVEVNDPLVGSNPDDSLNFTLTITDIDESPVVTPSAGAAAFAEDAGSVPVDSALSVSDPENLDLASAEIRFDSGFVVGQDDLIFANQLGISGSYNATSGILSLTGTASVAAYETALRSVTYSNSSQNPNTGNRVLRFTVNDGLNSTFATRTLTVAAQDDPANVVTGGPYFVAEGGSVVLDGSGSSDVDNVIVEYSWDFDYDGVTFSSDATGSTTNFSAASIDGPDTRTVALRTRSDNGVFALATTMVTVSNVAPTANADSGIGFTTDEDSAVVTGNVLTNDSDPGPDTLTVSSVDTTGTIGLVIDRGDGTFTYDPRGQFESLAPGQSANDTFSYTVTDGNATDTATVTIIITGANDAPVVSDQNVSVDENSTLNTAVATAAASDVDAGDSVSWTIVSGNTNGAFSINNTTGEVRVAKPLELSFESNPRYSLTVRAADLNGGADTGVITISLNDLNEAPTADNASLSIAENSVSGTSVGFVTSSDPDSGDTRSWLIVSGNTNGAFSLNAATGELTVANSSALDFETTPTYTLSLQVQDAGGLTDSAAVVVNVSNVNEAPTTTGLSVVFVDEDSADVIVDLKTAFRDVETPSAALTYSVVGNSRPVLFSGTPIVGGNLILNFAPNANGNATIAVRATDPQGLFVTTAFNVVVAAVADSPTSTPDSYVVLGDRLTVPPAGGVLANDSDPDGDALSALLVSGPANGSLVLLSNGGFTYTPDDEFTGIDTFVYEPFDGTTTGPPRTVVLNVVRVIAPPPSSIAEPSESGESVEAASTSESDGGETVEAVVEAQFSANAVTNSASDADAAEAVTAPQTALSDDDAEDEITGTYTETESGGEFFSEGSQRLELRDASTINVQTLNEASLTGSTSESENRFRDSLRFQGEDLSYLVSTEFIKELEQVEDDFEFDGSVPEWATGTAVATTASLSVGYIMWMLRGGYVLASVLSTMPVWQNIDPLPVLAALEATDADDDESLETMIDRASDEADDLEEPNADLAVSDAERKDEIV